MESVFAAIGIISIMSVVSVAEALASGTGADAQHSPFKAIRW